MSQDPLLRTLVCDDASKPRESGDESERNAELAITCDLLYRKERNYLKHISVLLGFFIFEKVLAEITRYEKLLSKEDVRTTLIKRRAYCWK